jgi:hypothetical protein
MDGGQKRTIDAAHIYVFLMMWLTVSDLDVPEVLTCDGAGH